MSIETMGWDAVAASLGAAVLHAAWNAGVKAGKDRIRESAFLFMAAGIVGLCIIPFVPVPNAIAFAYMSATLALHIPYLLFLARAYDTGELGHVYTIARGLPPMLVAIGGALVAGEIMGDWAILGIACVTIGVLAVGLTRRAHPHASRFAFATAIVIACYSLIDGIGVRASGTALGYGAWFFALNGLMMPFLLYARRGAHGFAYDPALIRRAALGGPASFASYALVLWAMSVAPIAGVIALRETSVVFAALIAAALLGERLNARRIAGVLLVAAGASLIKLG